MWASLYVLFSQKSKPFQGTSPQKGLNQDNGQHLTIDSENQCFRIG